MTLPRPFHLILEFSIQAFNDDYPNKDVDGCKIEETREFDFSDCPDCGYDDKKQSSKYGQKCKMIMFLCQNRVQKYEC